jgi:glycosyltransferase involved in cell wall biosynthesis
MVAALAAREDFRAIYLAGEPAEMQRWIRECESTSRTPLHVIPFSHRRYSPLVPLRWARVLAQVASPNVSWFPHWDSSWRASPSVTTLHDIIHLADGSLRGRLRAYVIRQWMRWMIAGSDVLLTGSRGSLERIASEFPEARGKLQVVPHGVADIFFAAGRGELDDAAANAATNADVDADVDAEVDAESVLDSAAPLGAARFLLTVASKRPHKRLETAIRAFAEIAKRDRELRLVMVGARDEHTTALRDLAAQLGVADRVDDKQNLSDRDLALTYRRAEALLVPSREEGFGLVIIEAMAAGTPVIAVDAAPLPEVAGGAATIVPLDDHVAMAAAIRALEDPATRAARRAAGRARAEAFTWAKAAHRTAAALLEATGR